MWFIYLYILFIPLINVNECDYGCKCFEKVLDSTSKDFRILPIFQQRIILSTEALLMRKMPQLDLSTFVIHDRMNLKVIDLTGNVYYISKTKF